MENEIIIKNGTAGVEINGRFYTHTNINNTTVRLLDVLPIYIVNIWVAMPKRDGEYVYEASADSLTPIPNPALDWPAGTKVMVRDCDAMKWKEAELIAVFDGFVSSISRDFGKPQYWKQCKLADGGE